MYSVHEPDVQCIAESSFGGFGLSKREGSGWNANPISWACGTGSERERVLSHEAEVGSPCVDRAAHRAFEGPLSPGAELFEGDLWRCGQRHPGGLSDEPGELDGPVPFVQFSDAPVE